MSYIRPNITYAIGVISQFMHRLKEIHLQDVNLVLQYLKGKLGKGILFKRNARIMLEAYTNTDYARSVTERRLTSRYYTFLDGNLVKWRS